MQRHTIMTIVATTAQLWFGAILPLAAEPLSASHAARRSALKTARTLQVIDQRLATRSALRLLPG